MNDDLQFELLHTFQEKRKFYDDKGWEIIIELLKSKPYENKEEQREFLKKLAIAITKQNRTLNQAHQLISEAGHNIAYNTLATLLGQED